MSIAVRCLQCAQGFSAPEKLAGKRVKCPKCSAPVAIPLGEPSLLASNLVEMVPERPATSAFDPYEVAGPVTLRPLPPAQPKPTSTPPAQAAEKKASGSSQLKQHAPTLELIGVLVFGAGLFGLFAFFALHYTSTWRDLGMVFLLGGGVLFGMAQALDFDSDRFGRALGVLFFFCVISGAIGGGIEVASGRVKPGSLKFWGSSDPDTLFQESKQLVDDVYSVLAKIRDLPTANQHAEELNAADERFGEWLKLNKDKKIFLTKKKEEELRQRKDALEKQRSNQFAGIFRIILQAPNASQSLLVIRKNLTHTLEGEPGATQMFDSLIRDIQLAEQQGNAQSLTGNVPTSSPPTPTPLPPTPLPSNSAPGAIAGRSATDFAEQHRQDAARRHQEMLDRTAKQLEDARARAGIGPGPNGHPGPSLSNPPASNPPSSSAASNPLADSYRPRKAGISDELRDKAEWAFTFHQDAAGQAYLQAAALAGSDEALKPEMQWCPALKRPAFSLYWGIGVSLEAMADAPPADQRWLRVRRPLEERRHDASWGQTDEFKKRTGDVGMGLVEGLQQRIEQREFGDWGGGRQRSALDTRGLAMFKVGPLGWTLQQAREIGLDVLIMIHLQDKKSAAGPFTELQINLLRVADGQSLWHSETLSDRQLRNARRKGDDPAVKLVAAVFNYVDKELKLSRMPAIKPEIARKRSEKIANDPAVEPLAALFETRYYQILGLLTADEAQALYAKKAGEPLATALATGEEISRGKALAAYFSK